MENNPPVDNAATNLDWSLVASTEIPLHGKRGEGLVTLVDGDYDGEYFSQYRWYVNKLGYAYRSGPIRKKTIFLHEEVLRVRKGLWRDHINRNKLDNRSCNLRAVTPKESASNRGGKFEVRK